MGMVIIVAISDRQTELIALVNPLLPCTCRVIRDQLDLASITGDELDSTVHLPNVQLVAAWHAACVLYIAQGKLYLSTGLLQPREHVKFGQRYMYLSEKVALSL